MPQTRPHRCSWCDPDDPLYIAYHDTEWCVPVHDDRTLFELLILECFQAGLSWKCVLHKRAHMRRVFDGFEPAAVAAFTPARIDALMEDPGIIRCRRKLCAAVTNAQVFLRICAEFGGFEAYLRSFAGPGILCEWERTTSPLSLAVSTDLKKRGMKYVGPTILYAYLQAVGILHAHEPGCFLHRTAFPDR